MCQHIGLDVSLKDTAIAIRQDGQRVWRGKYQSDPEIIAQIVRKRAPNTQRVVFETGALGTWFFHVLTAEGLPAICIEARHAQKILDETLNKTDANDADPSRDIAAQYPARQCVTRALFDPNIDHPIADLFVPPPVFEIAHNAQAQLGIPYSLRCVDRRLCVHWCAAIPKYPAYFRGKRHPPKSCV